MRYVTTINDTMNDKNPGKNGINPKTKLITVCMPTTWNAVIQLLFILNIFSVNINSGVPIISPKRAGNNCPKNAIFIAPFIL